MYYASEFIEFVPAGEGAYGAVLAAQHKSGEQMAIKVCASSAISERQRASLQSEIDLMQHISHPNVVGFRGLFLDDVVGKDGDLHDCGEDGLEEQASHDAPCLGFAME